MVLSQFIVAALVLITAVARPAGPGPAAEEPVSTLPPVLIGMTAEFSLPNSTSAQAIEKGIRIALTEINGRGGVLGGRPLTLVARDDRSVPARGIANVRELAAMPEMVGVFCGRFSPVMIEITPVAHDLGVILLDAWSSADIITHHGRSPNFAFRYSLKDSNAMPVMLDHARRIGTTRIGVLLPNTAWGRSNQAALAAALPAVPDMILVRSRWYNWGDQSLSEFYLDLVAAGAEAVILVANDREASILVREVAALPAHQRRPLLSHWGIAGGRFFEIARSHLELVDLSVIQTFSFARADREILSGFMMIAERLYGISNPEHFESPVGVGHAYDLTRLLALAIDQAGTTDRYAVRQALERLGPFRGLVRSFPTGPFSPENHDALDQDSVFMARYRSDGVLEAVP